MHTRTVFYISDGTGITAETFGNAILAQFEMKPRHVRLPFIDTMDKAHQAVRQINHTGEVEGKKPIVFTTLANDWRTALDLSLGRATRALTRSTRRQQKPTRERWAGLPTKR